MRPMKVQFVQFTVQIFSRPESMYFVSCCGYLFSKGLALCCGSRYFNLDDCWAKSRKEDEHWWQTRQEDGVEQNAT